ncbi:MAG: hypothetical protein IPK60_08450 [Sandaracinaceae bacterium]|nr:hypothetical protein [Sandaracinaceae bacterium]
MNQHTRSLGHVVQCLFTALLVFGASHAAAQSGPKRVVVRDFTGPQAERLHDALVSDLRSNGFEIVEESEMRSAASTAGVQLDDGWQYRVAQQLRISAVISGTVARHGRRFTLTVRVRNGNDGASLGTETWRGRNPAQLASIGENGHERLGAFLASAHAPDPAVAEAEHPWQAGDDAEGADDDGDDDEDADDEDEDEADEDDGENGRYDSVRASLAIGTIARSMSTTVVPVRLGGPSEERRYSSSGLGNGQIGLDGEFYLGALGSQAFPYVGLVGGYHRSLFLNTQGCDSTGTPCPTPLIDVGTSQQDYYIGLRGRYAIGHRRDGIEIAVDATYGGFSFKLDEPALAQITPGTRVPTFGYSYLNFGLGVNIGVVERYLTVGLHGAIRAGLSVAAETRNAWGVDTKGASGFVLGLNIRSEAPYIADGMFFGLGFELLSFSTKFEGQTSCLSGAGTCTSPNQLWEQLTVPEPVTDTYYRLTLAIGYALR